jgi:ATP-binding cassette subfamily B protein
MGTVMTGISQGLTYKLRKEVSEKINRIPMKYFETRTYGEVLSRVTNDIDTLSQSLNQCITQVITSAAALIGIIIMMLSISPIMTFVAFMILPLSIILMTTVVKRSQKYFGEQQEYLARVNGQVEEVYAGHNVVRAYNKEADTIQTFEEMNNVLYNSAKKSQFLSGMIIPVMSLLSNLAFVSEAILGGYFVIKKAIVVGDVQAFLQYVRFFTDPIHQVAQVFNLLQSTSAASERVFNFLEESEEEQFAQNPVSIKELKGNVAFEHVRFGYSKDKIIIQDFNAKVQEGQKIAIVGHTGAGKTTMIKLLMRFYDVNDGSILIDGHDIRNINRSELRQVFGMVLQDTWLFNGSIKENIQYGRLNATDEEILTAAKASNVHHFVQTLPDGYNMVLNEEATNVSQGQKQLLTIAMQTFGLLDYLKYKNHFQVVPFGVTLYKNIIVGGKYG